MGDVLKILADAISSGDVKAYQGWKALQAVLVWSDGSLTFLDPVSCVEPVSQKAFHLKWEFLVPRSGTIVAYIIGDRVSINYTTVSSPDTLTIDQRVEIK